MFLLKKSAQLICILIVVLLVLSISFNILTFSKLEKAYNEIDCIISKEISDLQIELKKTESLLKENNDNLSVTKLNDIGKQLYTDCYPIVKKISTHCSLGDKYKSLDLGDFEIVIIDMVSIDDTISNDKIF